MRHLLDDVQAFHEACGVPVLASPTIPEDRVGLRLDILDEEHKEFRRAVESRDIVQVADALADIIYVAVGTAFRVRHPA